MTRFLETINYHGKVCREVSQVHELWLLAAKVQLLAAWSGEGLSIATEGDTIISPILCTRQVRWSEINVMLPEASRGDCKRRFSISMPSKSVSCQFYQPEWSRMKSFYSSDLSQTRTSNHGYFCAFVCALMFSVCMCSQVCMYCFIHQRGPTEGPKECAGITLVHIDQAGDMAKASW